MKVFAIFYDNGEEWEDNWSGILEDHVYSSEDKAKEVRDELSKKRVLLSKEEYLKVNRSDSAEEDYQYYVDTFNFDSELSNRKEYTVVPIEVID